MAENVYSELACTEQAKRVEGPALSLLVVSLSNHRSVEPILYYGDNLEILRRYIEDESVDLVHLDPPFKSDQAQRSNLSFQSAF